MRPIVAVLVLSFLSGLFGGKAHRESERGNREYEAGNFDEALGRYTEAQVPAPEAPELPYDIGNVLYRKQDYEGAADAYRKALAGAQPSLAPDVAYNLGNSLFRQERFQDAAGAYRQTLESRPDDVDARRNLELALRALERQTSQPPPQPQQQPRAQDPPQSDERQPQPQPQAGERERGGGGEGMSPQDAERLLDRIGELEKDAMRRRAERAGRGESPREKDW